MVGTVRRMRSFAVWCGVWCLAVITVTGCSSGETEPATSGPATADDAESTTTGVDGPTTAPTGDTDDTGQVRVYAVAIDVAVDRLDLTGRLEVAIDPDDVDEIDPFTRFSSCSGLRASVGTFTVTAVDDTAAVRAVSVVTVDRVTGPGIYDADVRVEPAAGDAVSASGTVTLDEGLRSGSFQAFEPSGGAVSGMFTCDGPPGAPEPIVDDVTGDEVTGDDVTGDDVTGVLRAVEVVALLRRGDEERIVGLTLDTAEVAAVEAVCPSVTDDGGSPLVRVDGGLAVGAITTFELAPEQAPGLRMIVGGAAYEIDDVEVDLDDRGASGTFSGVTTDGIAIDGAFRCA